MTTLAHDATMLQRTYKIGEVANLTGLKPFVLRYWETEFPQLVPIRTKKGQRLYTDEHIALLEDIKSLLYGEKLTIDGARRRLAGTVRDTTVLRQVYDELCSIRRLLEG
jgi:DNA-binding transcriptional MerR regulator